MIDQQPEEPEEPEEIEPQIGKPSDEPTEGGPPRDLDRRKLLGTFSRLAFLTVGISKLLPNAQGQMGSYEPCPRGTGGFLCGTKAYENGGFAGDPCCDVKGPGGNYEDHDCGLKNGTFFGPAHQDADCQSPGGNDADCGKMKPISLGGHQDEGCNLSGTDEDCGVLTGANSVWTDQDSENNWCGSCGFFDIFEDTPSDPSPACTQQGG